MPLHRLLVLLVGCAALSVQAQSTGPTVAEVIPAQTLSPGGAAVSLDLANYFTMAGATTQVVVFDTVLGKFAVALRPDAAPQEVSNFLGYVQRGDYANSIFHRSAALDQSGSISIVQGGGYTVSSAGVAAIPAQSPVPLEYNLANARGTIAAARNSDPNSATSQWFINVRDDTDILGPSNGGGYTVFGQVLGSGMSVVDAIAALPRVNASGGDPTSPFQELPVRNYTSGAVQPANLVVVNSITPASLFPTGSGTAVVTFTVLSSNPGVVGAAINNSTLTLTPAAAGSATVTITATDINGGTVSLAVPVTVAAVPPSVATQPSSVTVATGSSVVLTAGINGALTYQWQHNGANLPGATSATLFLSNASASTAGTYALVAANSAGAVTTNAATVTVANVSVADVGRLANLSIRSSAGSGDQTLIVGFNLGGSGTTGSTPLLLRGIGPSLTAFGLTGVLPDPVISLFNGSTVIATNDNWGGDATIEAWRQQVGAFSFASTTSLDAALAVTPAGGSYTMKITGNGTSTGLAIGEIYDATPAGSFTATTPRLINVSARSQVGTGANILIAGFSITGTTAKTVLIRAAGPTLHDTFGLGGTLADPQLVVTPLGSSTVVAQNNDWGGDPAILAAANSVGAFPFESGASKDAAVLVTLPPGSYSAQVSGADGGTGVALVEVYEVP